MVPLNASKAKGAEVTFLDPINNRQFGMSFSELVTLITGSSIKSLALADDFFELGISDAFNLRLEGQFKISLISTLNKGERPPVRLQIIQDGETPTAEAVEQRIHSLRQLYATSFLISAGRSHEIADMLERNPRADLEQALTQQNRLFISAASEGTFWLTVVTKTKAAFKSLLYIAPLFYEEGRQAVLENVRATTDLKKLDVKAREMDLMFQSANKLVDLVQKVEKIKDPHTQEKARQALSINAGALGKQLPLSLPKPETTPKPKTKKK